MSYHILLRTMNFLYFHLFPNELFGFSVPFCS